MGKNSISLWFDLYITNGVSDAKFHGSETGYAQHYSPVSSIIVKDIYLGDLNRDTGTEVVMGFWEWIPRCLSAPEKICGYALPDKWAKVARGGWHWERENNQHKHPFLALTEDKPRGKKIGAINRFQLRDFQGYKDSNSGRNVGQFTDTVGFWVINDGNFNLSGKWQFVKLIYS